MPSRLLAAALFLACAGFSHAALSAERVEDFYGIWVDKKQSPYDCALAEGEGPWITIGPKLYIQASGDPCEDVEFLLRNGKLRVSASCSGDEEGFTVVAAEFSLTKQGELIYENEPYVKCRGEMPKWIYEGEKPQ